MLVVDRVVGEGDVGPRVQPQYQCGGARYDVAVRLRFFFYYGRGGVVGVVVRGRHSFRFAARAIVCTVLWVGQKWVWAAASRSDCSSAAAGLWLWEEIDNAARFSYAAAGGAQRRKPSLLVLMAKYKTLAAPCVSARSSRAASSGIAATYANARLLRMRPLRFHACSLSQSASGRCRWPRALNHYRWCPHIIRLRQITCRESACNSPRQPAMIRRRAALLLAAAASVAGFTPARPLPAAARVHADKPRQSVVMMPIGVPKVAYRVPGAPSADWIDIYNRLYRERIIFLGQEIDDELANQIIGVMLYLDSEDRTASSTCTSTAPAGASSPAWPSSTR